MRALPRRFPLSLRPRLSPPQRSGEAGSLPVGFPSVGAGSSEAKPCPVILCLGIHSRGIPEMCPTVPTWTDALWSGWESMGARDKARQEQPHLLPRLLPHSGLSPHCSFFARIPPAPCKFCNELPRAQFDPVALRKSPNRELGQQIQPWEVAVWWCSRDARMGIHGDDFPIAETAAWATHLLCPVPGCSVLAAAPACLVPVSRSPPCSPRRTLWRWVYASSPITWGNSGSLGQAGRETQTPC